MWGVLLVIIIIIVVFIGKDILLGRGSKQGFCARLDTLESSMHGDLSSRHFEPPLPFPHNQSSDLKAPHACWETNQMRALIDNSPTQAVECDIRPNCSQYMWKGDYPNF